MNGKQEKHYRIGSIRHSGRYNDSEITVIHDSARQVAPHFGSDVAAREAREHGGDAIVTRWGRRTTIRSRTRLSG